VADSTGRTRCGAAIRHDADINAFGSVAGPSVLDSYGHLAIYLGNFARFTNGGRNVYRPLNQDLATFGDTLTWIHGRHTFKFGADVVHNGAEDGFSAQRGNVRGLVNYTGNGVDALTRFLLGLPANSVSYVDKLRGPMNVHNWENGFFAQDDFKVHPRLTLNLGLRYELITPFVEEDNLMVDFDPNYVSPSGQRGRFVVPTKDILSRIDPRMVAYGATSADQIGLPRSIVKADKLNLAPRIGAAWRITDRTVLRGGYGLYYPTSAAQGMRDALATNAFNQGVTKNNTDPANPLSGWPGFAHGFSPLNGGRTQSAGSQPSVNAIPFDLHQPRIQQFNVTFERELGWKSSVRLSYLGTRMSRLITGRDLNMIPPSDIPFGTTTGDGVTACDPYSGNCDFSPADLARRPFPLLGDYMASFGNFGHGRSNAFQVEVNRRFAGGFLFSASYTLLDQKSNAVDSGNSSLGGTAYNQFKPENDFSRDSYVPRHRAVAYGIWQLPIGANRQLGSGLPKWADAIVGGWETAWNLFIKSGTGFTPFWTCDNCGPAYPGNVGSSFIDADGSFNFGTSFRPIIVGDPMKGSGDRIFNPAAFAPTTVGADALDNPNVARRNVLTGPGTWGVNLGVHKIFRIGERVRADLGADFNNVFNHPLKAPTDNSFAQLGSFNIGVDPNTRRILPITDVTPNPDFGRLITSYSQENIDSRRTTRLKLRITF
jgi:hypothetical protein